MEWNWRTSAHKSIAYYSIVRFVCQESFTSNENFYFFNKSDTIELGVLAYFDVGIVQKGEKSVF